MEKMSNGIPVEKTETNVPRMTVSVSSGRNQKTNTSYPSPPEIMSVGFPKGGGMPVNEGVVENGIV